LSSRGSKLVGRRGIPSVRRVKSWVQTCERLTRQRSPADPQLAWKAEEPGWYTWGLFDW